MRTSYSTWQPVYFALFSITVVVNVVAAWLSNGCPQCADWQDVITQGGTDGAVYGTIIVSLIEVIRIMIILPADYLSQKFVEPLKQRQRAAGRAKGLAEGRAEGKAQGRAEGIAEGKAEGRAEGIAQGRAVGKAQGRAELRAEIMDWLRRKEEHEREGKEFNEPMPGLEEDDSAKRNGNVPKDV